MLHGWVFDGVLADRNMEFFVACDESAKPDKMWRSKYTLRQSMLPSFIPQGLAQKVGVVSGVVQKLYAWKISMAGSLDGCG